MVEWGKRCVWNIYTTRSIIWRIHKVSLLNKIANENQVSNNSSDLILICIKFVFDCIFHDNSVCSGEWAQTRPRLPRNRYFNGTSNQINKQRWTETRNKNMMISMMMMMMIFFCYWISTSWHNFRIDRLIATAFNENDSHSKENKTIFKTMAFQIGVETGWE